MIDIAGVVRNQAVAVGAGGWLDRLDGLVTEVAQDWRLTVGRVYRNATEAFVAEAIQADGTPVVLKVLIPYPAERISREVTVLQLTGGDGCVRLLRHDLSRGALLLERLGPSLYDLAVPYPRRLAILSDTAARVWRPASGCGLPTGAERARWLRDAMLAAWEELGYPCSEQAVAHALACAERRIAAHDDERAVLVHGDVRQWNALACPGGFRLVDPDGLLAEPEYDLGVLIREDPLELVTGDPYQRAKWLAARHGLDPLAIWEWGVLGRVATGLLCTRINLQPIGQQMLAVADWLARSFVP